VPTLCGPTPAVAAIGSLRRSLAVKRGRQLDPLAVGYELESQRRELPDPDTDLREVYARRPQVDPAEVVRLEEVGRRDAPGRPTPRSYRSRT
jgi:hypothetical protein